MIYYTHLYSFLNSSIREIGDISYGFVVMGKKCENSSKNIFPSEFSEKEFFRVKKIFVEIDKKNL